jgi:HK97 family phage prohead protease
MFINLLATSPLQTMRVKFDRRGDSTRAYREHRARVVKQVNDRQIRFVATDGRVDRTGEIVEPGGAILDGYLKNPVVLAFHDVTRPVARCTNIDKNNQRIVCDIAFPPVGQSSASDEICNLLKFGALSGFSIGFNPVASQPMDPRKPRGPQRYTSWQLLEISVVAVPANDGAVVVERSIPGAQTAVVPNEQQYYAHFCAAKSKEIEQRALQAFYGEAALKAFRRV